MDLKNEERISAIQESIKKSQESVIDLKLINVIPNRILKSELIDHKKFKKTSIHKPIKYSTPSYVKVGLIILGMVFTFGILFANPFGKTNGFDSSWLAWIVLIVGFNGFLVWTAFFRKTSIEINKNGISYGKKEQLTWDEILYAHFEYDTNNEDNHLVIHKKTGGEIKMCIDDFINAKIDIGNAVWSFMNQEKLHVTQPKRNAD
tara:strand:+ start:907 stop:1518 length:612 start_codon:yes stop_codon:yes gene_type:complete